MTLNKRNWGGGVNLKTKGQGSKVEATGNENVKKLFFAYSFVQIESIYVKPRSK